MGSRWYYVEYGDLYIIFMYMLKTVHFKFCFRFLQGYCAPRLCGPDRVFVHITQLCHDPRDSSICPRKFFHFWLISSGKYNVFFWFHFCCNCVTCNCHNAEPFMSSQRFQNTLAYPLKPLAPILKIKISFIRLHFKTHNHFFF